VPLGNLLKFVKFVFFVEPKIQGISYFKKSARGVHS
jgi:hypothetical protein